MMLQNPYLHFLNRIYGVVIRCGSSLQSLFLLYIRLTWGHALFLIGLSKWHDVPQVVQMFAELHIPAPTFHAHLVALCEIVGGVCFMVGFASRLASIPIGIIMFTAFGTAHWKDIFHVQVLLKPALLAEQPPYMFLFASLLLLAFGPGCFSLDGWIKRWIQKQPHY